MIYDIPCTSCDRVELPVNPALSVLDCEETSGRIRLERVAWCRPYYALKVKVTGVPILSPLPQWRHRHFPDRVQHFPLQHVINGQNEHNRCILHEMSMPWCSVLKKVVRTKTGETGVLNRFTQHRKRYCQSTLEQTKSVQVGSDKNLTPSVLRACWWELC